MRHPQLCRPYAVLPDEGTELVSHLQNGIGALKLLGYRFRYVDSATFDELVLLGSFAWPGHYDRILVSNSETAIALRTPQLKVTDVPDGDDATWLRQGDAAEVVWALVELAPPAYRADSRHH